MDEASRKPKGTNDISIAPREQIQSFAPTMVRLASIGLPTVDLDQLLLDRGWVAVCREDGRAMYDWPPSAPDADHEITYLIVDSRGDCGLLPYRVSVVNGERLMYDVAAALVADLDMIEARRCAACKPRGSLSEQSHEASDRDDRRP